MKNPGLGRGFYLSEVEAKTGEGRVESKRFERLLFCLVMKKLFSHEGG
jgi:hypothetical protein